MTHYVITLKSKGKINVYIDLGFSQFELYYKNRERGYDTPAGFPLTIELDYFDISLLFSVEDIERIVAVIPLHGPNYIRAYFSLKRWDWHRLGYDQEVHNDAS